MEKEQIYQLLNNNPSFFLATVEGDKPKVRGMLLFRADENGILFHTGSIKPVYQQILKNPHVELCFFDPQQFMQIRVSGTLNVVSDKKVKDEIVNHSSRAFVRDWKQAGVFKDFDNEFIVLRLQGGSAKIWTMATNLEPGNEVLLD